MTPQKKNINIKNMSSRKQLKKQINDAMSQLYIDCVLYKVYTVDADKDGADNIIKEVHDKHQDLISRVSVKEGSSVKGRVANYYKTLRSDLHKEINELVAKIGKLSK